jgi:hypothetical protein
MRSSVIVATKTIGTQSWKPGVTLALGALLAACGGGGGGGEGAQGSCADVAGVWLAVEEMDATACGSGVDTSEQRYLITQSACSIIVNLYDEEFQGTVSSNRISWTGSYSVPGGTITITAMDVTLAADGRAASGAASWRYSGGGTSCAGTTRINATRKEPVHVVSTVPAGGAAAVPITSPVVIEFSETIQGFPPPEKFTLTAGGAAVDGELAFTDSRTLTFTPSEPLRYATTYTATVRAGIEFAWGELLAADHALTFTTAALPEHDYWARIPAAGAPAGTSENTMVWAGDVAVAWGGMRAGDFGIVNTGGRYDPAADAWSPTSTATAPAARTDHTAVWTAGLASPVMVVWGGTDDFSTLASGGRYDPASDTWSPVSQSATLDGISTALPARTEHLAVWTGSRMLVWGGHGPGTTDQRVVWSYDPVADTWTGNTGDGVSPEGIQGASAVWTGTELIVWGGSYGMDTGSGSRYHPGTNTWSAISTDGAPSARSDHAAVWTGSRMIVWGGRNNAYSLDDGASYDPASDTWAALPPAVGLGGRSDHDAVWTGSEVVVWGGSHGLDALPGGRYDPATQQWKAFPTLNQPQGENGSKVVWSGTDVIVWGGWPSSDGGRYRP